MADYSYKYGGNQAAITFGAHKFPKGTSVEIDDATHKVLAKSKVIQHLIKTGELEAKPVQEAKPATK